MSQITAAFIFDPALSSTLDEQVTEVVEVFHAELGLHLTPILEAEHMADLLAAGVVPDVLVIDYGGLSIMNQATGNMQVWSACHFAEQHPSVLVVLWTKYTARLYEGELEREFGHLPNILPRYRPEESPYDYRPEVTGPFREAVKRWFGEKEQAHV